MNHILLLISVSDCTIESAHWMHLLTWPYLLTRSMILFKIVIYMIRIIEIQVQTEPNLIRFDSYSRIIRTSLQIHLNVMYCRVLTQNILRVSAYVSKSRSDTKTIFLSSVILDPALSRVSYPWGYEISSGKWNGIFF